MVWFQITHKPAIRPTRPATATALWAAEHVITAGAATAQRKVLMKHATAAQATTIPGLLRLRLNTAMQTARVGHLTAVTAQSTEVNNATEDRQIAQMLEITTKEQQPALAHVLGTQPIAQRVVVVEVARTTCLMQTIYKRQWQCTSLAL